MLLVLSVATGCRSFLTSHDASQSLVLNSDLELQLGLAQRAERSGDLVAARSAYRDILEKHPEYVPALHRLGVVLVRLEQSAEAIDHLQKAANLEPPTSELLGDLGYAQFLHGDLASAEKTLERALTLNPTDPRLLNNQALVVGFLGRESESLELFRRAGSEADAMNNLGFIYAQRGELHKAKEHYVRALDLQPTMKNAAQALVDLHRLEAQP